MTGHNITIPVSDEKLRQLDRIARRLGRSRAWVLQYAVDQYLDYEAWAIEQIEAGRREAASGRTVPHELLMAELRKRIDQAGG